MLNGLFIVSLIGTCYQIIKESCSSTIPAENWANKDLYNEDVMNGVPIKQRMKNLENGKYKATNTYHEPHRDPTNGKIVIENSQLYYKDVREYGAYQAQKWVEQGKYNLTPEELEKKIEYIKKNY